ncbi:MAG: S9 family peptidase, partial [Henriciella sp.]
MRLSTSILAAAILAAACQTDTTASLTDEESATTVTAAETETTEELVLPTWQNDPYTWLEEVEGERALAWVRGQNDRTLGELQADPHYEGYYQEALDVLTSDERIPYGLIRDGWVYNFWQDETYVRGLWRRTPLESYATDSPNWETIVNFDKLAEDEGKNWVYKGANCFQPEEDGKWLCMISLSDGGKDAVIQREFDLETKSFVEGGFVTTEAKQGLAWVDENTVLIATDWGEGTTTQSGYPFIVKRWTRGTPLESAVEVIRGDVTDVGVWPAVFEKEDGTRVQYVVESDTFFTSTWWWLPDG